MKKGLKELEKRAYLYRPNGLDPDSPEFKYKTIIRLRTLWANKDQSIGDWLSAIEEFIKAKPWTVKQIGDYYPTPKHCIEKELGCSYEDFETILGLFPEEKRIEIDNLINPTSDGPKSSKLKMYRTIQKTKEEKPTEKQYGNYQGLYDYFNKKLFDNQLPDCILNFDRGSRRSRGHFSRKRWQNGSSAVHEINLNPKGNIERSDKDICSTLVHEMVHLWQFEFGKPGRDKYHNKQFAEKMESIGLITSDTGEPGGKRVGQRITHYIVRNGPFEKAFNELPKKLLLPFKSKESKGTTTKAPKNKIKYTCPECDANVWGKPDLQIICKPCSIQFNQTAL